MPRTAPPAAHSSWNIHDTGRALLLAVAVLAAYGPALHGGLLFDDPEHVTRPELRSWAGLGRIWTDSAATPQYFPLLQSVFWLEHRLWGEAVLGYHLANLVQHLGVSLLLVAVMRRLSLPGAWFAAFLFALHPVCVESVAWISEQKNTLSSLLALGALWLHLGTGPESPPRRRWQTLGLFCGALLCKSVTAVLPPAILVIAWWRHGRLELRRDVRPLLPWFGAALIAGLVTAWVEHGHTAVEPGAFVLSPLERVLLASRALWFYPGKLLWPTGLMLIYPHWTITAAGWRPYAPLLALLPMAAGLLWRARTHRGPLAAALLYAGALLPVLGFLDLYSFQYSYVADHFQYLAWLGLAAATAAGLTRWIRERPAPLHSWAAVAAMALLAGLAGLTWRHAGDFRDAETLYRRTLDRNPACWLAYNNLGETLMPDPARRNEAAEHFREALQVRPDYPEAHSNLGSLLAVQPGHQAEALGHLDAALRLRPGWAELHQNIGNILLNTDGRHAEAIGHFEEALRRRPGLAEVHHSLGIALTEIPGRLPEAAAQFEEAVRLRPDYAVAHFNLGLTLLRLPGRAGEAPAHFTEALRLRPDFASARQMLERLQAGAR